jgi:hypothetical protein
MGTGDEGAGVAVVVACRGVAAGLAAAGAVAAGAVAAGACGAFWLPSRELSVGLQLADNAIANSENVSAASATRAPVQIFFVGALDGCSEEVMRKTFLLGFENHRLDNS